jgi:hypothetical protein
MLWFGGFEFDGLAFHEEEGLYRCRPVEKTRRAYFRFLYPVMLMDSSGTADFSFRPAFR